MTKPIRILLVEDNPGDARLLMELLREARGLTSTLDHVDRLDAAKQYLAEQSVDVVLLDLSLPDAHGLGTVTEALASAHDLPIIVLTGLDDERVALQAMQLGAQDYLVKGQVEPILLARSIRYAIERKQLDRERQHLLKEEHEARSRAETAVRARDHVLRVVSHDLGNYLSAIKINAAVLLRTLPEQPDASEARNRAAGIGEQVMHLQRLRQDLLDAASIEAGHLSIEPRSLHPRDLLESAREHLLPLATEKRVHLHVSCDPDVPPVTADRERLLQALSNLLGNAIKFTPGGGEVRLCARIVGEGVRIEVTDTGVGIPAEHLPHVFDSFWKIREGNPDGAGLGLSIARGIIEAHGGAIGVESEVGCGSSFYFTLDPLWRLLDADRAADASTVEARSESR